MTHAPETDKVVLPKHHAERITQLSTGDSERHRALTEVPRFYGALGLRPSDQVYLFQLGNGGTPIQHRLRVSDTAYYCTSDGLNAWGTVNVFADDAERRTPQHVSEVRTLTLDVDVKPEGMPSANSVHDLITELSRLLYGNAPTVVVATGHGYQPHWRIEPTDDLVRGARLHARFGFLARTVADQLGGKIDSTFGIERIWRLPGTINSKDPDKPIWTKAVYPHPEGEEPVLAIEDIEELLDSEEIPESDVDPDRPVVSAVEDWTFGETTSAYVLRMISAWEDGEDSPPSKRNPWLYGQTIRLVAAKRLGVITKEDFLRGAKAAQARMEHWLATCEPRRQPERKDTWAAMLGYAEVKVATKTDDECWDEIGGRRGGESAEAAAEAAVAGVRLPDGFWEATDVLRHVRQAAHSEGRNADAVLGAALALTAWMTPHKITLPKSGRKYGTLDLLVGLVGPSGAGKSTAMDLAWELLPGKAFRNLPCDCGEHRGAMRIAAGTGEGLLESYREKVDVEIWEKGDNGKMRPKIIKVLMQDRHAVLQYVDEVSSLFAVQGRAGSILAPLVRTAWSGGDLITSNASAETRREIPKGSFRFAQVCSIQPRLVLRKDSLFSESDGGTPQRMTFFAATGDDVPNLDEEGVTLPAWPGMLLDGGSAVYPELPFASLGEEAVLDADPAILDEITLLDNRIQRGALVIDPLDTHRGLNKLKVAALLTALHRETKVSMLMWELAEQVMTTSGEIRSGLVKVISDEVAAASERRVRQVEKERVAGERAVETDLIVRGAGVVRRHLEKHHADGGECVGKESQQALTRFRKVINEVAAYGEHAGWFWMEPRDSATGDEARVWHLGKKPR